MKKSGHSLVKIIVAISLVSLVAVACAPSAAPETGEKAEVKVGLSLCLTGPAATAFEPQGAAVRHYLRYVNEELGGIEYKDPATGETSHASLDVMWDDCGMEVPRTISAYKRQKASGAQVMVFAQATQVEAVHAMAVRDQIALLSGGWAGTTAAMVGWDPFWYAGFQDTGGIQQLPPIQYFREQWKETQRPRLSFISYDHPSTRTVHDDVLPRFLPLIDIEYLGAEWLPPAASDSSLQLNRIMAKDPDVVLFLNATGSTIVMLRDVERIGMDKSKIMLSNSCMMDQIVALEPGLVEGIWGAINVSLPDEDLPGIKLAAEISEKYRGEELLPIYTMGIPPGMILSEALKLALEEDGYENLTSKAIRDAIFSIRDFDTGGIAPPMGPVDPKWPNFHLYQKMVVAEGGKLKPLSEWVKYQYTYPALLDAAK